MLELVGCGMGEKEERMEYLVEFLRNNETVTVLHLQGNQIGDEAMRCLSEGLKANRTVKKLWLQYNNFGDEGLQHLTEAVRFNTSLSEVDGYDSPAVMDDAKLAFQARSPTCQDAVRLGRNTSRCRRRACLNLLQSAERVKFDVRSSFLVRRLFYARQFAVRSVALSLFSFLSLNACFLCQRRKRP